MGNRKLVVVEQRCEVVAGPPLPWWDGPAAGHLLLTATVVTVTAGAVAVTGDPRNRIWRMRDDVNKYLCMLHLQSSNIISETLTDNKRKATQVLTQSV